MLAPDPLLDEPTTATDPRALRRLIVDHGGFTLDQRCGEVLRRGIAVCADPSLAWCFPMADWDDRRVGQWLTALGPRATADDVHLGGWLNRTEGAVWLELVWVLPERLQPAAVKIARIHGQHAVFDLRAGRLVVVDAFEEGRGR